MRLRAALERFRAALTRLCGLLTDVDSIAFVSGDDGGVSWVFPSCGASVGFLTRYDRELREPLVPSRSCAP